VYVEVYVEVYVDVYVEVLALCACMHSLSYQLPYTWPSRCRRGRDGEWQERMPEQLLGRSMQTERVREDGFHPHWSKLPPVCEEDKVDTSKAPCRFPQIPFEGCSQK